MTAWNEARICHALVRQVFLAKCLVLVPNCSWTGGECDLLAVTQDLRVIDVEIKISRADLRADAGKGKWYHQWDYWRDGCMPNDGQEHRRRLEWPQRVWKHYYAMPASIWRPELADTLPSPASGVILLKAVRHFEDSVPVVVAKVERRAKPNPQADRLQPEQVADIARLATLRLWDALAKEVA